MPGEVTSQRAGRVATAVRVLQSEGMRIRLLALSLVLAATACASAPRPAGISSRTSVTVKNESTTTIQLYVVETPGSQSSREVTKLGPGDTYTYRGPVPSTLQHNLSFHATPDIGTTRREVLCTWATPPGPTGRVTCQ
jgi:hypothetical protein